MQGDVAAMGMLAAAVALGYMYQGPPFRCSTHVMSCRGSLVHRWEL